MIYRITGSDNLLVQKVMRNTLTRMGFRETGMLFREWGLSERYVKEFPHLTVDTDTMTITGRMEVSVGAKITLLEALYKISFRMKGKR